MENNLLTIKGSFKGIRGDFFKNLVIIFCAAIAFLISKSLKTQYYITYNIDSFSTFLVNLKHIGVIIIICLISLFHVGLVIISVITLWNIIKLFYETKKITTFDFSSGRITTVTYSFPSNRIVEENKFNEIINVDITQGIFNRMFSTGNLYIEYLTYSKLDSQLRSIEINYVNQPFEIKPNMI